MKGSGFRANGLGMPLFEDTQVLSGCGVVERGLGKKPIGMRPYTRSPINPEQC